MTCFYIVRHGESEGNVNGDIFGSDPPLTDKGIQQAKVLAEVLALEKIDFVYCSDRKRAVKTAKVIASKKKLKVVSTKKLRERYFGELEGKTSTYIKANFYQKYQNFAYANITEQLQWKIVPDEESFGEVLTRVIPFFEELYKKHSNNNLLLVTHANLMLPLLVRFGFADNFSELPYGSIKNTGYIKIECDHKGFIIKEVFNISKQSKS